MKCSQCGAEATLKGCEYCGSAQSITVDKDAPPAHLVATEVWRCKNCDRLVTGRNPHLWCIDNGEEQKIHDLEKVEVHMAAKCHLCNEWRNPSEVFCGNRHGKIDAYVVTAEGKWIKHTPNPKPKPTPPPPPTTPQKPGYGCGTVTGIISVLVFLLILATGAFNVLSDRQKSENARKEHERVMALRPWDNNPGLSQQILNNLSKEDKKWVNDWTKGKDWVSATDYQTNHPENMRGRVTSTVSPKNPGDFKDFIIYSDWGRNDQGRWEITSEWRPFIQVP